METKKEKLNDYLITLDDSDLMAIVREYNEANNYPDNEVYYMEEINEILGSEELDKVLRMAFYGDFNPMHNYFKFNGYGNLESFDYLTDAIYLDDIVDYIINNDEDFNDDDIREILDEEEAEDGEDD